MGRNETTMSNLQTLIYAVEADGLLFNHRSLAEKVSEEAREDQVQGRRDDHDAKMKALWSLGYNSSGHPMCEDCKTKEAAHETEIDGLRVCLCDNCYDEANK